MAERVRADVLLVNRGLFDSRARAQAAIEAGGVTANGTPVRKASEKLASDAKITADAAHPYVSRGGVKLAGALDHFNIDPKGRRALDVGSSTGGFSHVLLLRGAASIVAVDTGRDQLHMTIREDARVTVLEGTDIRKLDVADIAPAPDLAVIDVSFISLTLVLPAVAGLLAPGAEIIALIKPQFEVGRGAIGKGGIVRDDAARDAAIARIETTVKDLEFTVLGLVPSSITGGDGNQEWLMAARRQA